MAWRQLRGVVLVEAVTHTDQNTTNTYAAVIFPVSGNIWSNAEQPIATILTLSPYLPIGAVEGCPAIV